MYATVCTRAWLIIPTNLKILITGITIKFNTPLAASLNLPFVYQQITDAREHSFYSNDNNQLTGVFAFSVEEYDLFEICFTNKLRKFGIICGSPSS